MINKNIIENIKNILNIKVKDINLEKPPKEEFGDYAFSCFDLGKELKKNPAEISKELAEKYITNEYVDKVKSVGPYLNIYINPNTFLKESLIEIEKEKKYGSCNIGKKEKVMIEFSSPNTNKPQHLGHVRNNCLGQSLSNILEYCGYNIVKANLINDRGIHIVKSMLAWQELGNKKTPKSTNIKGDHFVGKYYVLFNDLLKKEKQEYLENNNTDIKELNNIERKELEDNFLEQSPLMKKARKMLQDWENNDKEVRKLWKMMNDWVYEGYKKTYNELGISFDKIYHESETYLLGKDLVEKGLKENVFFKKEDNSVWIDLSNDGLDEKLVLRKDGTSVYMTQDFGTAKNRFDKLKLNKLIYIVGNEQDYHFKALFLILKKLGFNWSDNLHHLSYGMVNLPEGKMKSREGTVVDADDIIQEMKDKTKEVIENAEKKIEGDKEKIIDIVGLGALKFFMLKTNPKKDTVYNPKESISFDGYTGPFIQYTHARISNILKKGKKIKNIKKLTFNNINKEEVKLMKILLDFPEIIKKSGLEYNPSILTNYLFNLAKVYNNFYQNHSVLNAETENLKNIRLQLSKETKNILNKGLELLGIQSPDIM